MHFACTYAPRSHLFSVKILKPLATCWIEAAVRYWCVFFCMHTYLFSLANLSFCACTACCGGCPTYSSLKALLRFHTGSVKALLAHHAVHNYKPPPRGLRSTFPWSLLGLELYCLLWSKKLVVLLSPGIFYGCVEAIVCENCWWKTLYYLCRLDSKGNESEQERTLERMKNKWRFEE